MLINVHRNYFWRIVWIDHFSKHSLHSRFVACNVHIDFRIHENIIALNIVITFLSTCSNCLFQNIITWMFSFRRINFVDEIHFATFRVCFFVSTINHSTSFNSTFTSRKTLVEKKDKNQLIASRRSWKKTKNNVTNVHWIQHQTNLISN